MFECYENIIAVSETTCNCFPDNPEIESKSGLYLDELEGLEVLTSLSDCETGNIWEIGQKAINEAIKMFVVDSNNLILKRFKQTLKQYNGLLGWSGGKDHINIQKNYAGLVIDCRPVKSGVITIKDIGLIFDATNTINIKIFDQYSNMIEMVDCMTLAGKRKSNEVNIKLPIFTKEYGKMIYFLVYEVASNVPLDNKVGCDCGGGFTSKFNSDKPYYFGNWNGSHSWANWCMIGGIQTDDLVSFDEDFSVSNYANGISLSVDMNCNYNETLCEENMDYSEPLNMCKALAVRYKAAELISLKIINSTKLKRESFLSQDVLNERLAYWTAMYSEKLNYLIQNTSVSNNGCLGCNSNFGIGKILS